MATVHYENGHYHLHAELKDISEEENKSSQQKASSTEKVLESTVQEVEQITFIPSHSILIPVPRHSSQDIPSGYTEINIPPPKIA